MVEQQRIRSLLKKLMKEHNLTYEGMAAKLKVSPATVKRRLNSDDLTLTQLAEFSGVFDMSVYDLMEMSKEQDLKTHLFTEEQERILAKDISCLSLFRSVLLGQSYSTIKEQMKVTDKQLRKALREMEEVGLLKVMPGDRLLPVVSFPFSWREGGKLEAAYNERILQALAARSRELMSRRKNINSATTQFKTFEFLLTRGSQQEFCEELGEIYAKYRNLSEVYLKQKKSQAEIVSGMLMVDSFSIWQAPKGL